MLRDLLLAALAPWRAFPVRAAQPPGLGRALGRMIALRTPLAFASGLLSYQALDALLEGMRTLRGPFAERLLTRLPAGIHPSDIQAVGEYYALPPTGSAALALLGLAPLWVLGLWLHDAVWDHGCLWMLGGLKGGRGFRATLVAEAEALTVGSVGAALGLLAFLPGVGWILSVPLLLVEGWFWILRGFALAAWQGCPPWKGVVATLLHVVLMGCCGVGLLALTVLLAAGLAA